jgi:hypothetical protein
MGPSYASLLLKMSLQIYTIARILVSMSNGRKTLLLMRELWNVTLQISCRVVDTDGLVVPPAAPSSYVMLL